MGSVKLHLPDPIQVLETHESFYKWFIDLENTLFKDLPPDIPNEEDEEDELPLYQRRKRERVKKYLRHAQSLNILLELSEDKRRCDTFVSEFCPLECFAVLGAIAFFNGKSKADSATIDESLMGVKYFVTQYKAAKFTVETTTKSMEHVLSGLETYLKTLTEDVMSSKKEEETVDAVSALSEQTVSKIFMIKSYFLSCFPGPISRMMEDATALIQQGSMFKVTDVNNGEWNLIRYHYLRSLRSQNCQTSQKHGLDYEKSEIETLLKCNPDNPMYLLASCQFMTDYMSLSDQSNLQLGDRKFETHSDIVKYIRSCSESVTTKFPSFIRAKFIFAEIFASKLSITKQDREYAKYLLIKTLEANPTSSKINHNLGLFCIQQRQFTEARNYLQQAINLEPSNSTGYITLVKLLLRDKIANKVLLNSFFKNEFDDIISIIGTENELSFWRGCYFFKIGDKDLAIKIWIETVLEFYVTKPEIELETVLPFKKLSATATEYLWPKSDCSLSLENIKIAVQDAAKGEQTRRRVVFHRLIDLIEEP